MRTHLHWWIVSLLILCLVIRPSNTQAEQYCVWVLKIIVSENDTLQLLICSSNQEILYMYFRIITQLPFVECQRVECEVYSMSLSTKVDEICRFANAQFLDTLWYKMVHIMLYPPLNGDMDCYAYYSHMYWASLGHNCLPARPSKPTGAAIENDRRGHRNRCVYRPSKMTGAAIETYRRGHRNLPARPSKMTGAAIKTYRRGHRNLPARPSKMTGAAIETVVYIGHRKWPARPSKPTGAAIETYRRGHRKWPARPSKPTGAAIETYRPVILDGRAGHFRWPRRSF